MNVSNNFFPYAGCRILVIGKNMIPDSMEYHVVETLRSMRCVVQGINNNGIDLKSIRTMSFSSQLLDRLMREPERRGERQLLNAIAAFQPELTLVIQGNQLSPKSIAQLRRVTSSPVICWCQDAISSYGRQYVIGAEYDAIFVKDNYLQNLFSQTIRSTVFHYLPEACNPLVHRTVELSGRDRQRLTCDVLMLGSLYYYRQEILRQLGQYDLRIYGARPRWLLDRLTRYHRGSGLVMDRKAQAVQAARVSLNTLHCAEIDGLNCRAFELAGCGGFQIIDCRPVLRQHFEPGVEIETFSTIEELKEKIDFYLANPDAARQIARRGQQRAHRDHTYTQRLSVMLGQFIKGRVHG